MVCNVTKGLFTFFSIIIKHVKTLINLQRSPDILQIIIPGRTKELI